MRSGFPRLAPWTIGLLLSFGCTSNQRESAPPPADSAQQQQVPADPGTETAVDPAPDTRPQPQPQSGQPVDAPRLSTREQPREPVRQSSTRAPAPKPPVPPDAPRPAIAPPPVEDVPARAVDAREAAPIAPAPPPRPAPTRMVSIPAETTLRLTLQSNLASDTSHVEDRVSARVARDVVVNDEVVIPEGSRVDGRVTYAQPSGKVKGRAGLTVRFHQVTVGSQTYDIATEPVRQQAEGTKSKDVRNIGIGAGAGAVIGGIIGGGKGAGIGAAVGGASGTGMVLATKGEEVRLASGTALTTRLSEPLVVELGGATR